MIMKVHLPKSKAPAVPISIVVQITELIFDIKIIWIEENAGPTFSRFPTMFSDSSFLGIVMT